MHRRSFLFAAAVLAAMLGASAGAQAADPTKVSASFSILGDIVKQVGGDRVEVFTFVDSHCWDDEHAQQFRSMFSAEMERFARDVRVIADYTQQRNLQRAVLAKIDEHESPGTPTVVDD